MEKPLTIGKVANAAGMSPSALRYYESVGLLPVPERLNGRRFYDDSIFAYLAAIRLAQESGFTVSEMKQLLQSCTDPLNVSGKGSSRGTEGWKKLAQAKIEELDGTVARAVAMKHLLNQWLECECVSLADCELIADRLRSPAVPLQPAT